MHNHIHNSPHGSIYVVGNNHYIAYNDIHHVGMEFWDMGAVYFYNGDHPLMRGHVVYRNYIHHILTDHYHGVYPDGGSFGVNISQNVFYLFPGFKQDVSTEVTLHSDPWG